MEKRLIGVKFDNTPIAKEYVFASFIDVHIGDAVVVDTQNGFTIGTVSGLDKTLPKGVASVLREVVDIIDFSAFYARKEKAEKIKTLKKEMDERVKELQDIAVYELLAEKDEELGRMLKELRELT